MGQIRVSLDGRAFRIELAIHWTPMRVRVLFFGVLRDLAGKAEDSVDLAEGSAVHDLLAGYESRIPRLKESLPSVAVAVNQQYASASTVLHDGDEVALLPPVSGGSEHTDDAPLVRIVRERIVPHDIISAMERPEDGAIVIFDGVDRNHSRNRKTL